MPLHEAISGLSLTARNYPEAVSILKKRSGDRQRIIGKHMEALLHLDTVQNHSARSLCRTYDEVESHVRSLNLLGVLPESYGSVVASTLLNKLPHDVQLIVSRGVSDAEWNLECFLKTLNDEIEARERAVSKQICPQSTVSTSRKPYQDLPAAHTLFSSTDSCAYCGSAHSSNSCNTVTDVDSRKQILRKAGKCFNCLKRHHTCRECRSSMRCSNCRGKHHPGICHKSSDHSTTQEEIPSMTSSSTSKSMYTDVNTPILLQTARAVVLNPDNTNQCMTVRILFDGGSQRSYITDHVKRSLGLSAEVVESVLIKTFGSKTDHTQLCDIVKLLMRMKNGETLKLSLLSVPFICDPVAIETLQYVICNHPHLRDLELADRSEAEPPIGIDILIGADNYWNLVTGMIIRHEDVPTAMETPLGWVLSGPCEGQSNLDLSSATGTSSVTSVNYVSSHVLPTETDDHLNSSLNKFWDLDTLGIKEAEDSLFERFSSDIVFKEGRYEVKLPWRDNHPILPSNYQMSLKRLFGLLRRFKSDLSLLKEYNDVITDQLNRGIVEMVKEPNLSQNHNEVHYIPHHAVIRRDKETTKLRIVFDGSAKENGPSLNECLHTGPSLYQGILEILLRFRMLHVGLIGDIEKAFLMVSVAPEDRDVLRFLWVDDIQKEVSQVVTLRFKRVIFGVSCSPFLLNATIYHHLLQYQPEDPPFVHKFLRSIYVDDLVSGASTTDEAFHLYSKSKACLKEGGFNLRQFVSNSPELQEKIDLAEGVPVVKSCNNVSVEDESYSRATFGANQGKATEAEQKVLGVVWNVQRDCLVFDLCHIAEAAAIADETKRGIASVSTRFYDPIGVLSPCIVMFKLLLQKIWESGLDWDQPLTGELLSCWRRIVIEIKNAKSISIPRCSLPSTEHASSKAYAAVVYLLAEFCGTVNVQLLVSKNRVAPKGHTIPRLELLSALPLSRLLVTVTKARHWCVS